MEWRKDDFLITDDRSKVQLDVVHRLLAATYWGGRRPSEIVERMVLGSICFSLYHGPTQVGFGRAVTDGATFTWVADIVIQPEFRGHRFGQVDDGVFVRASGHKENPNGAANPRCTRAVRAVWILWE